ncbi:ComF family protein [Chloroflexota bacterium]
MEGIRSVLLFEGLVRQVGHGFKYGNMKILALPLGRLMAEYLASNPLPVEVVIPVPLHKRRLRRRGYNQSSLLGGQLSRITGLSLAEGALIRLRDTPSQASAGAAERRDNVEKAFACTDMDVQGKRILLIDDVCTTGATLDACAVALKEAGAASVWGLALARET